MNKKETDEDRALLLARLTPGERECLVLVGRGLVSKEIARDLGVSPHTVDARLRAAAAKLGTRSRFVAAAMLAETAEKQGKAPAGTDNNLIYEDLSVPDAPDAGDKASSAGEGKGSGDLDPKWLLSPESPDSGRGRSWLEPSHPLAKFLGGENRLPIGQRLLFVILIAIAAGMAFSALTNSLIGLSRLISSP
jgi:DNA-binding CsgD family transcriptional regulator